MKLMCQIENWGKPPDDGGEGDDEGKGDVYVMMCLLWASYCLYLDL